MDEKFKTSLELDISKFKEGIERVKETFKNVGNVAKKNIVIEDSDITEQIKKLQIERTKLLEEIKNSEDLLSGIKYWQDTSIFGDSLEKDKQALQEIDNQLEQLNSTLKNNNIIVEKTNNSFNRLGNINKNLQKGFDKGLKSAKRFTLSLFGIHSVYRMLSRASSAYLSQDEETTRKIQSAWIGLGSIFAPILEKIANFVIKAVKYINVFIKALTGVDFLARAMDKSMNKANKTAGKLSKTLAGFDELTNLDDSSSGADMDTSWIDAFKDVPLDENVVTWLENIAEKMKPIIETSKQIGGVIKDIWDSIFAPFFTFILDNWDLIGKDFMGLILLIGIVIDGATGNWLGIIAKLVMFVILYWDDIKEALIVVWDLIVATVKLAIKIIVGILESVFYIITEPFKNAWKTIKDVWGGAKTFFKGIKDLFVGIFTLDGTKIKNGLKQMLQGMGNIIIAFIEGAINGFLIPINAAIKLINKIPGVNIPILKVTIPRIPKLDVGTNYVPEDTLAMIHKGEAVVPKKFNSSEYFSGGNDETNNLLRELIETLEEKDMSVSIDKNSIGQASADYINSQKRIMGRGVI
ncbi:MAG TPA: hypothetical protein GX692_05605 [Acholeplasmataceae bacterium]|nr:hypothetical protein [Acholeplasmataceae bacterium]